MEQHDPNGGLGVEHRVGEEVDAAELHVAAGNDAEGIVVLKKQPVGVHVPQHGSQQHENREEPHLRNPPPALPYFTQKRNRIGQPEIQRRQLQQNRERDRAGGHDEMRGRPLVDPARQQIQAERPAEHGWRVRPQARAHRKPGRCRGGEQSGDEPRGCTEKVRGEPVDDNGQPDSTHHRDCQRDPVVNPEHGIQHGDAVREQREFHLHVAGAIASPQDLRVQEIEAVSVVIEGDGRQIRRPPFQNHDIPLRQHGQLRRECQRHRRHEVPRAVTNPRLERGRAGASSQLRRRITGWTERPGR